VWQSVKRKLTSENVRTKTIMNESEKRIREAVAKIAEAAQKAVDAIDHVHDDTLEIESREPIVCTPKKLPKRLLLTAAETAVKVNPVNAPASAPFAALAEYAVLEPQQIAVLTQKYWGPQGRRLTVSFMEATPVDLRARIVSHMNAWTKTASISFIETQGTGDVRISRGPGGYWSYLGTDILHIPKNRQTMNLQGFTMSTPESEYKRVVRHETGHTLGMVHEHLRKYLVARIDPQKAYDYFLLTQGWNEQMVDLQVLTPLDEESLMATPPDQTSIMCYQLPGSITRDRRPIVGGSDINDTDYAFAGKIYPKVVQGLTSKHEDEWDPSEDVNATEVFA
jgi:hypothetical protein